MQQSRIADERLERVIHLLEDWRTLTLGETSLINLSDWSGLEELQKKKAQLQVWIEESQAAWVNTESLAKQDLENGKARLRKIASELEKLESTNRDLLSTHLARTDQALKEAGKTISSLRHIQNAYGKTGSSFWQAYS